MKKVLVNPPINTSNIDPKDFGPWLSYQLDRLVTKHLKNVFVTYSGLCANRNGLIKECHHREKEHTDRSAGEMFLYLQNLKADPDSLIQLDAGKEYLVIHHPWYNYYHWMFESIFRLWMVRKRLRDLVLLLPDYYASSDFMCGSLAPFDIRQTYCIPEGKSVLVPNLCLPQLKPVVDSYQVGTVRKVRKFYLDYIAKTRNPHPGFGERIYISRKKATRKKVLNEDEVEQLFAEFGFITVCNEDFPFLDQIAIYSHAKFLASIHGSGLGNMLFMKEGSFVLEMHKSKGYNLNRPSFVFWYLADALGFSYLSQLCRSPDEGDDYFFGDFVIDIPKLRRNLQQMRP